MNLQQLEYALALEKLGSFTQAAKTLHVTQPALSLQIKNLENEIGISLFDRSRTNVEPTERGLKFLLKAGEIVSASKQLKDYAMSLGQQYTGKLKIGVIPTLSPFLIPLFLDDFNQTYQEVSIEVHELLTEQILQKVRLGELDGGVISTPISRQGIEVRPLFYESFFLYQNQESNKVLALESLKLSNIDLGTLWLLEEGNCFRDQVNDICSFKHVKTQTSLKYFCSNIDSLIRMVDHFGGITILPELTTLSLDNDQEKSLVILEGKIREIGFINRKSSGQEHLFEALCTIIERNVPRSMKHKDDREVVDPGIDSNW
ncbi:LysR substrate-binding domain-containing protein [Ekhidna sp.]